MRQSVPKSDSEPNAETAPARTERDGQGRFGPGNQARRKHPKPALEDPAVQQQLAHRRDQITTQRGGRDHLTPMQLGDIERFVILEAFVTSWESYFMKSSPISRQGRVRSGYKEGYLSSLDRLMKLGAHIGVQRVAADVDPLNLSAADYAASQEGGHRDENAPESNSDSGQTANTETDQQ